MLEEITLEPRKQKVNIYYKAESFVKIIVHVPGLSSNTFSSALAPVDSNMPLICKIMGNFVKGM